VRAALKDWVAVTTLETYATKYRPTTKPQLGRYSGHRLNLVHGFFKVGHGAIHVRQFL
jgi:hypothetical protein